MHQSISLYAASVVVPSTFVISLTAFEMSGRECLIKYITTFPHRIDISTVSPHPSAVYHLSALRLRIRVFPVSSIVEVFYILSELLDYLLYHVRLSNPCFGHVFIYVDFATEVIL
jgi:hypothetical protein